MPTIRFRRGPSAEALALAEARLTALFGPPPAAASGWVPGNDYLDELRSGSPPVAADPPDTPFRPARDRSADPPPAIDLNWSAVLPPPIAGGPRSPGEHQPVGTPRRSGSGGDADRHPVAAPRRFGPDGDPQEAADLPRRSWADGGPEAASDVSPSSGVEERPEAAMGLPRRHAANEDPEAAVGLPRRYRADQDREEAVDVPRRSGAGGDPEAAVLPGRADRSGGPPGGLRERLSALVPESLARARLDPGRRGAASVVVVAVIAAVVVAFVSWRSRPAAVPVTAPAAVVSPGLAGGTAAEPPPSASRAPVVVAVTGKVRRPGVVTLPAGSRVIDAVKAAGGPLPGVDMGTLNLARKLADGELVVVGGPAPAQQPAPGDPSVSSGQSNGPLDLNAATVEQLDALPGVGPVLAQRIVDYRTAHGRFESIDQLREVDGIGDSKFGQLRDKVTV